MVFQTQSNDDFQIKATEKKRWIPNPNSLNTSKPEAPAKKHFARKHLARVIDAKRLGQLEALTLNKEIKTNKIIEAPSTSDILNYLEENYLGEALNNNNQDHQNHQNNQIEEIIYLEEFSEQLIKINAGNLNNLSNLNNLDDSGNLKQHILHQLANIDDELWQQRDEKQERLAKMWHNYFKQQNTNINLELPEFNFNLETPDLLSMQSKRRQHYLNFLYILIWLTIIIANWIYMPMLPKAFVIFN